MIGLVDLDWETSSQSKLIPNLEIMKLSSYYKLEENKFCRLLPLEEQPLDNYDMIYIFSEINSEAILPNCFLRANNLIFGGTALTNGVYVPFKNQIIDYTLPRPDIYKEFLKKKYSDGIKTKVISHFLDDTYYRCYAGEEKLPLPVIRKNKRVLIYDKDIFYQDWEDIINQISKKNPSGIYFLHPIICDTLSKFFDIRKCSKIVRSNEIILDLNIPLNEVDYMFKKYKNLFLAEVLPTSKIFLKIGDSLKTNSHYFRDLIYKLNLLYSFWARDIPIKIKYIPPKIGFNNPLENISKVIETWSDGRNRDSSINMRIVRKNYSKEEEERDFLLKFFPSAKDLFDQNYNQLVSLRRWRL